MPKFSSFTGFGFLRFSGEPSEAEKIYKSMLGMYRDPADGRATIDVSQGTYQEAKVFATSKALAAAYVTVQSSGDELKPETSYYTLEKHEKAYKVRPPALSTIVDRRAVLNAKQKASRGPRYEALDEGLRAILGDDLAAIRVIATDENENWPASPGDGPGIFNRHDTIAKSILFLDAVARKTNQTVTCDTYRPGLPDGDWGILTPGMPSVGQSFTGMAGTLEGARFWIKGGVAATSLVAKLYAHSGTFGTNGIPTGAALATSGAISINAEIVASSDYLEVYLPFLGGGRVALVAGTKYFIALEYATNAELSVAHVTNGTYAPHAGNVAYDDGGGWDFEPSQTDLLFEVIISTTGNVVEVAYENANDNEADVQLLVGDVLCVNPGNLGLAERVVVTAVEGTGDDRKFSAIFTNPHSAGTFATTGPMPIWLGSKRHYLIAVPHERAVDPATVRRVDEFMKQISRGCATWALVEPTLPGAGVTGPFKLGATSGSPLGAVPVEPILFGLAPPETLAELFGLYLKHVWSDEYDDVAPNFPDDVGGYHLNAVHGGFPSNPQKVTINGHDTPKIVDGVTKGLKRAANFTTLDGATAYTIACVMRSNGNGVFGALIDKAQAFYLEPSFGNGAANFYVGAGGLAEVEGTIPIDDDEFHTVIATCRGDGIARLFVDAVADGTDTGGAIPSGIVNDLLYGVQQGGTTFDGDLPIGVIATRGVTDTEVGYLHNILRAHVGL